MDATLKPNIPPRPASITDIIEDDPAKVTWLEIRDVALECLPDDIDRLTGLVGIEIHGAALDFLPPSFDRLKGLQSVTFNQCRFTALPRVLAELPKLDWLDLEDTPLTDIPGWLATSPALRSLYLRGTGITELTPSQLPANLGSLGLPGTLPTLADILRNLPNLTSLFLSDWVSADQIAALPDLCPNLEALILEHPQSHAIATAKMLTLYCANGPAELPSAWQHSALQRLEPINCGLTTLPDWLGRMRDLQGLNLSSNALTDLPPALADAPKLEWLYLNNNPLKEPLASLAELGPDAVLSYLRARQAGEETLHQAKLVLVGEGKVGKSSLIAALRGEAFQDNRDTTHGIELGQLTLPHPDQDGVTLTLNSWDFGGQEIYRATHQFFFSPDALYLLLWNPREGAEACELAGWLKRLKLRLGERARVLLVATHAGEGRRAELDWPALARDFGAMLAGHHVIDSKDGIGLEDLKAAIAAEAAKLPQMGGKLPVSWLGMREGLAALKRSRPYLAYGAYLDQCRLHGIADDRQAAVLARLLHQLGYVIHFADQSGLGDIMVLEPEWLTKAISMVFEDKATEQAGGVLDHARLTDLWRAYPAELHPFFLRMMEEFDISYRIPDRNGFSLVGQMVPYGRPEDLPWQAEDCAPDGTAQARMICTLGDEAVGLIPWTIVRNHRYSTGLHWRGGTFLENPADGSQALIELNARKDRLSIAVRGQVPAYFMGQLRDGLQTLFTERWPGLETSFQVPCGGTLEDGRACDATFALDDLIRRQQKRKHGVECTRCDTEHDIVTLLYGVTGEAGSWRVEFDRLHHRLDGMEQRLKAELALRSDELRRLMNAMLSEDRNCPPLFTLIPKDRAGWNPRKLVDRAYHLQLWCTHPGHQHPVGEPYEITPPKEWLVKVAPYAGFALKALRLVVPIGDAAALTQLDSATIAVVKDELNLMDKLAAALPSDVGLGERLPAGPDGRARGAELRQLSVLLKELDTTEGWRGLSRVMDKASGDWHWVCPEHRAIYDPPLPDLSPHPPARAGQG
ncbi:MAG: hypothetical protein HQL42_18105 [Alphaproteobacteria bacterium]|nr:hypothetical protein [Alphaproteobacteria bacterium]